MKLKVLYEDNHIIAVFKPAGVLVQKDQSNQDSLIEFVKKYLKEKYKKPGNVFLGSVHRLDRNVSGIVLFGKTSKGAARLSEQFRNDEIIKIYYAIVEGKPGAKKEKLIHYIKKDEERRKALVSESSKDDFDYSELEFEVVRSSQKFSLLKIKLITGRFHQIRSQLSAIGFPIAGDAKYGSKIKDPDLKKVLGDSIALCSTEISFKTATGEDSKDLKINYPEEWDKLLN